MDKNKTMHENNKDNNNNESSAVKLGGAIIKGIDFSNILPADILEKVTAKEANDAKNGEQNSLIANPYDIFKSKELKDKNFLSLFDDGYHPEAYREAYRQIFIYNTIPANVSVTGEEIVLSDKERDLFLSRYSQNDFENTLKISRIIIEPEKKYPLYTSVINSVKYGANQFFISLDYFNQGMANTTPYQDQLIKMKQEELHELSKTFENRSSWLTMPGIVLGNLVASTYNIFFEDASRAAVHTAGAVSSFGGSLGITIRSYAAWDTFRSSMGSIYGEAYQMAISLGATESQARQVAYDRMITHGIVSGGIEVVPAFMSAGLSRAVFAPFKVFKLNKVQKAIQLSDKNKILLDAAKSAGGIVLTEAGTEALTSVVSNNAQKYVYEEFGKEYNPEYGKDAADAAFASVQGYWSIALAGASKKVLTNRLNVKDVAKTLNDKTQADVEKLALTLVENNGDLSPQNIDNTYSQIAKETSGMPAPVIEAESLQQLFTKNNRNNPQNNNIAATILKAMDVTEAEFNRAVQNKDVVPFRLESIVDIAAHNPELATQIASITKAIPESVINSLDAYAKTIEQNNLKDSRYINTLENKLTEVGLSKDDAQNAAVTINTVFKYLETRSEGLINRELDMAALSIIRKEGKNKLTATGLADNKPVITLFNNADYRSVVHQTAHYVRSLISELDRLIDEPVLKADIKAMNDFVKAKEATPWTAKQEKLFARAFEEYLITGKAPNKKITNVFMCIKSAVANLYSVFKGKNPDLKNDMTVFFDHLMENEAHAVIFKEKLINEYTRGLQELGMDAFNEIDARIKNKHEERAKLYDEFKEIATIEAKDYPARKLIDKLIRNGGLNEEMLSLHYGKEAVQEMALDHPGLITKDGATADEAAAKLGVSWEEMINEINTVLPADQDILVRSMIIEAEHIKQNPVLDIPVESETKLAYEAVNKLESEAGIKSSEYQAKVAAMEFDQWAQNASKDWITTQYMLIKAKKDALENGQTVHQKTNNTTSLETDKIKLDLEHVRLIREYKDKLKALGRRLEEINKVESKVSRIMRFRPTGEKSHKGVSKQALDQVRYLLVDAGFSRASVRKPDISLKAYIDKQIQGGATLVIPEWIINASYPTRNNRKGTYRSWGYAYIIEFSNSIDNILHASRIQKKQNSKANMKARDELINQIIKSEGSKAGRNSKNYANINLPLIENSKSFYASTIKLETSLRVIDGTSDLHATDGAAYTHIYQPINEAYQKELKMLNDTREKIKAAIMKLPKEQRKGYQPNNKLKISDIINGVGLVPCNYKMRTVKYAVDGVPYHLTREEMLMVALNSGTMANREALIHGNHLTHDGLQAVWDMLTPDEIQLVQDIWSAMEHLYDPMKLLIYEETGINIEKVQPYPLKTKNGIIDGGYFPIVYDRRSSKGANDTILNNTDPIQILINSTAQRVSPKQRAHIKSKMGSQRLLLNFGVIDTHIADTIHDITHRKPVKEVKKIIFNKKFMEIVKEKLGNEYNQQVFKNWIDWNAQPKYKPVSDIDLMVNLLKENITIASTGYALTVAASMLTGIPQAIHTIGNKWVLMGIINKLGDTNGIMAAMIDEMSPIMAERRRGIPEEQNLQKLIRSGADITDPKIHSKIKQSALWFIGKLDMFIADSIYYAAYEKAISQGATGDKARQIAEHAIRTIQPVNAPKDSAAVQHGSNIEQITTMYYKYVSSIHNRLWLRRKQTGNSISHQEFIAIAMLAFIMPALVDWITKSGSMPENEDDVKDMGAGVLSYSISGLPVLRDITEYIKVNAPYLKSSVNKETGTTADKQKKEKNNHPNEITATKLYKVIDILTGNLGNEPLGKDYKDAEYPDIDNMSRIPGILLEPANTMNY